MKRSFPILTFGLVSLLAAFGVFFVPVSFSVQGFGMLVSPDGVRIIRSVEDGVVHYREPSEEGWFAPGQVATVVEPVGANAQHAFLVEKLRRDLLETATMLGESISKLTADLAREQASHSALVDRVITST